MNGIDSYDSQGEAKRRDARVAKEREQTTEACAPMSAGATIGYQEADRQSGQDALRELIGRQVGRTERLVRLLNSLPAEMNPAADDALWDLVKGYRP